MSVKGNSLISINCSCIIYTVKYRCTMTARKSMLLMLPTVALLGGGCFVYRYTTTPPASGRVINGSTQAPVIGARVGFRNHDRKATETRPDGGFHLGSDHVWAFSPLIPFEFTPCGGILFVEAPGYSPFETNVGMYVDQPLTFEKPIVLKRTSE
jgi:hypothetical protein